MEKKKVVSPKIKNLLTSTVLITANQTSKLILSPNEQAGLNFIQEVIAVGPHIKAENGYDVKAGDKVLLNVEGLMQQQANGTWVQARPIGQQIAFNNETGEVVGYDVKDKNTDTIYYLIDSRRILLVVE